MHDQEIEWLLKEKYGGLVSDAAKVDIAKIRQGEPVAYVIGFVDFLDCRIDLSRRPLIPRAETEFWLEQVIRDIKRINASAIKCLDIFAGSGCIGIAVLKHIPSTTVSFADSSSEAIKQISINCELNSIESSRYRILESNMFENITGSYDYIFANPPYVAEDKKDQMQESVALYEPASALLAGPDGLKFVRTFLNEVRNYLNPEGEIYLEFDEQQKDEIEKMLIERKFSKYDFYRDQFKKWRYLRARS